MNGPAANMDQQRRNPSRGTTPHPDHFDPTKFGPNGNRITGAPRGRKAKLTREEVAQVLFLEQIVKVARLDLLEYLEAKGFATDYARAEIMARLHKGWRPQR
jgi:hypothetical protein